MGAFWSNACESPARPPQINACHRRWAWGKVRLSLWRGDPSGFETAADPPSTYTQKRPYTRTHTEETTHIQETAQYNSMQRTHTCTHMHTNENTQAHTRRRTRCLAHVSQMIESVTRLSCTTEGGEIGTRIVRLDSVCFPHVVLKTNRIKL